MLAALLAITNKMALSLGNDMVVPLSDSSKMSVLLANAGKVAVLLETGKVVLIHGNNKVATLF